MNFLTKNISSLEKALKWEDTVDIKSCDSAKVLKGESFSCQVCTVYPDTRENG